MWCWAAIGGVSATIGGILLNDSFGKAKDLEKLLAEIQEEVLKSETLPPQPGEHFSGRASELRIKLRVTRFYGLVRFLRLVRLPKEPSVLAVAELLTKISGVMQWDSEAKKQGFFYARSEILRLLQWSLLRNIK